MEGALPSFRHLLEKHHAAMLAADVETVMRLREAHDLALRLNHGAPGILAGPGAPGCRLERDTAAAPRAIPLWGQRGDFVIAVCGIEVRIALDGVFGLVATAGFWPGFGAHAVDPDRPFLSETGYRSFMSLHHDPAPGVSPDALCRRVIDAYVDTELNGRLPAILPDLLTSGRPGPQPAPPRPGVWERRP
jgi:hypothetical protein